VEEGQAQVSVVGTGIGASREALARALQALPMPPVGVRLLPLRLSLLVPRAAGAECLRYLHAEFIEKGHLDPHPLTLTPRRR
jgi:aspartokinase